MRKKYLRFEQMEVFRPIPVTQQMRERIRQEAHEAMNMYQLAQIEPKQAAAHDAANART